MSKGPRPRAQLGGAAKTCTDAIFAQARALHCCVAFAASLQGKVAPPRGRRWSRPFPRDVDVAGDGKRGDKRHGGGPDRGSFHQWVQQIMVDMGLRSYKLRHAVDGRRVDFSARLQRETVEAVALDGRARRSWVSARHWLWSGWCLAPPCSSWCAADDDALKMAAQNIFYTAQSRGSNPPSTKNGFIPCP